MLKKIKVADLDIGMHLHKLCGPWMSHPFFRTSFKLTDPRDIQRIVDSGIREVWIDPERGLDVDAVQPEERDAEAQIVLEPGVPGAAGPRVSLSEELHYAARICAESKHAVLSMFHEARMGKAIEAERAMHLVDGISASVMRNPGALISLARLKNADDYTYMHSVAVCGLMIALARQLGFDEQRTRDAGLAGLLHDVGKMAIPLEVLNKPGKLTDAEFALIKTHPEEGHRMLLRGKRVSEIALDVCMHHHEKADASGYPQRLPNDGISQFARMCAVCDVYDAVTSDRPYKKGWEPAEAVRKMAGWSNGHFENRTFQAFVKAVGIYPIGTLVRLNSGRLGVIVEQSGQSLLSPMVKVFYSTKSQLRLPPELVDLADFRCSDKIAAVEDSAQWQFSDLEELWRGTSLRPW